MSKFDILKYYEIALRDVENIIGVNSNWVDYLTVTNGSCCCDGDWVLLFPQQEHVLDVAPKWTCLGSTLCRVPQSAHIPGTMPCVTSYLG